MCGFIFSSYLFPFFDKLYHQTQISRTRMNQKKKYMNEEKSCRKSWPCLSFCNLSPLKLVDELKVRKKLKFGRKMRSMHFGFRKKNSRNIDFESNYSFLHLLAPCVKESDFFFLDIKARWIIGYPTISTQDIFLQFWF